MDRAGLVGADGPTHHGTFDLTYLRLIPNMVIMAPKDEAELRNMLFTAVNYINGPIAIRYPPVQPLGVPLQDGFTEIPFGKSEKITNGHDVALLAVGNMVEYAKKPLSKLLTDGIHCEIINMRFIKPLDLEIFR